MTTRSKPTRTLTPEQLSELLHILEHVDSVEIKLSVPDANRRSAVSALGMDPLDAQIRQVVFFDTPDLTLDKHGVVVRARRVQGKPGDSIIKLRPVVPETLPEPLRRSPAFGVEVDAMPGGYVCSASMKGQVDQAHVKEVMNGARPIRKLFTKEQRALYAAHAPEGLELDDLSALGPINVLKLKFTPEGFARKLVAELWMYPDGSRILELSAKCTPPEAFQMAAELRAFLGQRGVDLEGEQQTKTRAALTMFSRELAGANAGAANGAGR